MITEAITTAAEYVAGLGLDAAKERAHDKLDERKLRTELINYIERQRKYNEMCTMAEEIDFQGLVEYIQNNLLEQAGVRIFDPNSKKRGHARQEIVDAAVACSKANTKESKYRVATCISICLDIIRGFYEQHHLSVKDYLLADMIVDAVAEEVHEAQTATVTAVDGAKEQILAKIDNTGTLFSVDKALALVEAGEVDTIGSGIKKLLDHITIEHPYYPHFGYDYRNGMILSKPLTAEAKKLYPPKLVLTGAVRFGDWYYNDPNGDPLSPATSISDGFSSIKHHFRIALSAEQSRDPWISWLGRAADLKPERIFPPWKTRFFRREYFCMDTEVKNWLDFAKRDLDVAKHLNTAFYPKPLPKQ